MSMIANAVSGLTTGISNAVNQHKQDKFNKEQWAWQKDKYEQTRNDNLNATYLKTQDLERSGLNKALAMGGGVQATTAPTAPQMTPVQSNVNAMSSISGIVGMAQQAEQLKSQQLQNMASAQDLGFKKQERADRHDMDKQTYQHREQDQQIRLHQGRASGDGRSVADQVLGFASNALSKAGKGISSITSNIGGKK
ncbi:MAG: hypothetical protein ACRCTJ_02185 [Brevinema sp.]